MAIVFKASLGVDTKTHCVETVRFYVIDLDAFILSPMDAEICVYDEETGETARIVKKNDLHNFIIIG